MKAKDLDKIFDEGDVDFTEYLDLAKAFKPGQEQKRVNVDFPVWMLERIDKEAGRLGVPRQSLIKVWIGEKLEMGGSKKKSKAVVLNG
jgi:predicted DNA binding CopG/RHH family protein